jgi:integrase/recombinase XerC
MNPLQNDLIIDRFERWLNSSYRADGTIRLRMRHVRQLAAKVQLTLASEDHLEQQLTEIRHLSEEARHSVLASWRLFYKWATSRRLVLMDPTTLLDPIPVRVRMPKVAPDPAVSSALVNATPRDRAMILLARYGCLRLTELTELHMNNRDGDRLLVLGKGSKERIVYANEPLLDALLRLELDLPRGYYFPGETNGHMHSQSVHKVIKRVTGWNPHALRHAGATAAYRNTGDLRAVQDMLGHASLATTQRYLHLEDEHRRRVANATIIPMQTNRLAA